MIWRPPSEFVSQDTCFGQSFLDLYHFDFGTANSVDTKLYSGRPWTVILHSQSKGKNRFRHHQWNIWSSVGKSCTLRILKHASTNYYPCLLVSIAAFVGFLAILSRVLPLLKDKCLHQSNDRKLRCGMFDSTWPSKHRCRNCGKNVIQHLLQAPRSVVSAITW